MLLSVLLLGLGICTVHYQSLKEEALLENKVAENAINKIVAPEYKLQRGSFTDPRDTQIYPWVQYDNGQKWMAQNLNYKMPSAVCYNDETECAAMGRLYTWSAARKACPTGWRLAKVADWKKLLDYFGGDKKAFTALKEDSKSSFGIAMGGAYNTNHKSFHFIHQNGNYWTATSTSNSKAMHYNFSAQFKQVFSLEEDKALAFSCRCIEGQKDPIIAAKERKEIKKTVPPTVITPTETAANKPVITTNSNPLKGTLSFEIYNSSLQDFQLLSIKGNQTNQSADLKVSRPGKHKKEAIPSIRFQYTGKEYPYVIALAPNEQPTFVPPLSKDMDQADIIKGRPKPKGSKKTGASYFLQQEAAPEISLDKRCFLVLLSSSSLAEEELINKIVEDQNKFIQELFLTHNSTNKELTGIVQNTIEYRLPRTGAVIVPLLFSLQTFSSSI